MAVKSYDAIVIGAGPAGAAASRRLVEGGMNTLLVEKYKLPRRKMCSGLLSRWTVDFVHGHFGPMPENVYTETPFLKGFGFNFPSIPETVLARSTQIPSKWAGLHSASSVPGSSLASKRSMPALSVPAASPRSRQ